WSPEIRHRPRPSESTLVSPGRARRGASGSLNPQSAPAGPNTARGAGFFGAWARARSVDGRVPRTGSLRTASGPEGSSAKEFLPGAAVRPGPSKRLGFLPGKPFRRRAARPGLAFDRTNVPLGRAADGALSVLGNNP